MDEHIILDNKKTSKVPLVLGVISLITWLIPIVGIIVSIVGIVISVKKMKNEKSTISKIGLALCIIGLISSLGNCIYGTIIIMSKFKK